MESQLPEKKGSLVYPRPCGGEAGEPGQKAVVQSPRKGGSGLPVQVLYPDRRTDVV